MFLLDYFKLIFISISGFFIAMISSVLGIGGGVFTVPLIFFTGKTIVPEEYLGVMSISGSLVMAFVFSVGASIKNYKEKLISFWATFYIIFGASIGASIVTFFVLAINTNMLMTIFSLFLILNGSWGMFRLIFFKQNIKIKKTTRNASLNSSQSLNFYQKFATLTIGIITGIISSLTGIGGGVIIVPLLLGIVKLNARHAVATSSFCIVFISLSGSLAYFFQAISIKTNMPEPHIGFLYLPLILPLLIAGFAGGYIGSTLNKNFSTQNVKLSLSTLQILIALKIMFF